MSRVAFLVPYRRWVFPEQHTLEDALLEIETLACLTGLL